MSAGGLSVVARRRQPTKQSHKRGGSIYVRWGSFCRCEEAAADEAIPQARRQHLCPWGSFCRCEEASIYVRRRLYVVARGGGSRRSNLRGYVELRVSESQLFVKIAPE